jgi:hypothetical protein
MIPRFAALVIAWAILAYCPLSSAAQATQTQRISFAPGAYSATVQGSIAGDRIVDYKLGAKAGQTTLPTISMFFRPARRRRFSSAPRRATSGQALSQPLAIRRFEST